METGFIPEEFVAQIRQQVDLVEVVSRYVSLKRAGKNLSGLCPFHSEKTPSFTVSPAKQVFHCFGCNASGNLFGFLMRIEGQAFPEVVRSLADRLGLALPTQPMTPAQQRDHSEREGLFEIHRAATAYFHDQLLSGATGKPARDYLARRGLSPETIERFRLGYAPAGWSGLHDFLKKTGWKDEIMERAGLVARADSDRGAGRFYDRFRNRAIFPIFDLQERVIGFGGRALDDATPKYLNSPETPLFSKGRHLFALEKARAALAKENRLVIVEGYFDAVAAHQAGVEAVAATLGTALTAAHLGLVRRLTDAVTLIFDPDPAGIRAALRTVELILPSGLTADVVLLPEGKDPDSFIQEAGAEGFRRRIADSKNLLDFALEQHLKEKEARSISGKLRIARELLPSIQRVSDPLLRGYYVKRLSEGLDFKEEDLLRSIRTEGSATAGHRAAAPEQVRPLPMEEEILLHLLVHGHIGPDEILAEVSVTDFQDLRSQRLLGAVVASINQYGAVSSDDLTNPERVGADAVAVAAPLLVRHPEYDDSRVAALDCIRRLKSRRIRASMIEIDLQIRTAESQGDSPRIRLLQEELIGLKRRLIAPDAGVSQTEPRAS